MGDRICEDCGLPVVICIAKDMVNEAAKQHGRAAVLSALDAAEARAVGVQCCMCGKRDLSTVEDDGGTECELHDGRWVCNSDCYNRATHPASPLGAVAMREKAAQMVDGLAKTRTYTDEDLGEFTARRLVKPERVSQSIRALPLPTGDELFAAAAERPEVRALVEAAASFMATGKYWEVGNLEAALAPFTRKGE